MRLFRRKPKAKTYVRLQFFLKTGGTFTLDRVNHFEVETNGPNVTSVRINQDCDGTGSTLIAAALDLKQIAAVIRLPD